MSILNINTARRISQIFFLSLFTWFCVVTVMGQQFWMLRGWPVNWILQLDPLVGLATVLTTHKLYIGLAWGLVTIALTVIFGRVFCGFICPLGTLNHAISYIGLKGRNAAERIKVNKFSKAQAIKYYILVVFLIVAAVPTGRAVSLWTGLLDPIPLVTRSFNLVLVPIANVAAGIETRFYPEALLIGTVFLAILGLNLVVPRFFCRFLCPTGALLGILDRFAIWRIGKNPKTCVGCKICEQHCQGGCEPAGQIMVPECILCFNCTGICKTDAIEYKSYASKTDEQVNPDISRRGLVFAAVGGLAALPMARLSNRTGARWDHKQVRPPGSLEEREFLKRCIKCGQCMKVCPTNVLVPAGIESGLEAIWTPVLDNRNGTSGCQINCTACGYICPTAAIRPITLSEKLGVNQFADRGPLKIGTAFVDQSRCLPWSMGKPCIVCQENCPVSPKAIYTREVFKPIRNGQLRIADYSVSGITLEQSAFKPGELATGDYYCRPLEGDQSLRRQIVANGENNVIISAEKPWPKEPKAGDLLEIQVRVQRPYVDINACIGCGICEHECPVSGLRGIRVSAEGESRSAERKLLL